MVKYKWYRLLRVFFGGYRSFIKVNDKNEKVYIMVKGPELNVIVEKFISDGYVEEWPIEREISNG